MSNTDTGNALVCQYLSSLRLGPSGRPEFVGALRSIDEISGILAREAAERERIRCSSPSVWEPLREVWDALATRNIDMLSADSTQRAWTVCIARFTRNLVAKNRGNQQETFKFEPAIRTVVHAYTSHIFVLNEEEFMATRFLIQTISNIVTANEELLRRIWDAYLALPEERNILMRTVVHPDDRTAASALVLIANCLHSSYERMRLLTHAPMGRRLCVVLLDRLARYIEISDEEEHSDLFAIGWNIFKTLFDNGFTVTLVSLTTMEGEIVNPQQTTLLKLLDSYLARDSAPKDLGETTSVALHDRAVSPQISRVLLDKFFDLIHSANSSIRRSLGRSGTAANGTESRTRLTEYADENTASPLQSPDVLLPKVCETIVLVAQCYCSLTLGQNSKGDPTEDARWTRQLLTEATSPNGNGLVEDLIELLRLLNAFLPRIMFSKASWGTTRPDTASSEPIDKKEDKGFSYLKRDLIRLLGILCHENKPVQDRVRKCDGIPVVMSLCVTDERNPYLREHALLTLRNLLHNNLENQVVVDAIKPVGTWDENGVLRDLVGAQR